MRTNDIRTCGAHTLIESQEMRFVSGLAAVTQTGADCPFDDPNVRRSFGDCGSILFGWGFRKERG